MCPSEKLLPIHFSGAAVLTNKTGRASSHTWRVLKDATLTTVRIFWKTKTSPRKRIYVSIRLSNTALFQIKSILLRPSFSMLHVAIGDKKRIESHLFSVVSFNVLHKFLFLHNRPVKAWSIAPKAFIVNTEMDENFNGASQDRMFCTGATGYYRSVFIKAYMERHEVKLTWDTKFMRDDWRQKFIFLKTHSLYWRSFPERISPSMDKIVNWIEWCCKILNRFNGIGITSTSGKASNEYKHNYFYALSCIWYIARELSNNLLPYELHRLWFIYMRTVRCISAWFTKH